MSVVVVGLEHQQAPLDVLERLAVAEVDTAKVLGRLRDCANLQEVVLLSTCLRTEVYGVVDRFHDGVAEVLQVLAERTASTVVGLEPHVQVRFDDDVARHLFAVAAGMESAVPGESEVLGQVRRSWDRARDEGVAGPVLSGLFRHALVTGKRVRSETAISRGTVSFSHAAVGLAEGRLAGGPGGGLAGGRAVVVGAGELASGLVAALLGLPAGRRPAEVVVANRNAGRAKLLVEAMEVPDGTALRGTGLGDLVGELSPAALVLTAVDGAAAVIGPAELSRRVGQGPLLVVDLGMPRNVAPGVGDGDGVEVLTVDDLRASVERAVGGRHAELDAARRIVEEEVDRYRVAARARGAAPVVAALRTRLEQLRVMEVERRRSQAQAGGLDGAAWEQVDAVSRAVLAKLVHEPTIQLKESAGTARGERLVEALRSLFDL